MFPVDRRLLMKKLLLAAALACLAVGCASGGADSSMGYLVTDDGFDGCMFRYPFYPYYDPYAPAGAARMEVVRVERPHFPRGIDRTDDQWAGGPMSGGAERSTVVQPAGHPEPRAIGPRS
jgi:hypothetical protein